MGPSSLPVPRWGRWHPKAGSPPALRETWRICHLFGGEGVGGAKLPRSPPRAGWGKKPRPSPPPSLRPSTARDGVRQGGLHPRPRRGKADTSPPLPASPLRPERGVQRPPFGPEGGERDLRPCPLRPKHLPSRDCGGEDEPCPSPSPHSRGLPPGPSSPPRPEGPAAPQPPPRSPTPTAFRRGAPPRARSGPHLLSASRRRWRLRQLQRGPPPGPERRPGSGNRPTPACGARPSAPTRLVTAREAPAAGLPSAPPLPPPAPPLRPPPIPEIGAASPPGGTHSPPCRGRGGGAHGEAGFLQAQRRAPQRGGATGRSGCGGPAGGGGAEAAALGR